METVDEVILDPSKFDIYIRMNCNDDHDFCFQVSDTQTFKDLIDIFTTLPIVLNRSIFYEKIPNSFEVSHFPGQLTRTGGILFGPDADAEKYLTSVPLDAKITDHVLPGQLIIPVFKKRSLFHAATIAFLLFWLYTDLPDFISPTPGICLSAYVTQAVCWFLREILNKPERAQIFHDDMYADVGIIGQCIFFTFHVLKVLVLYFILWAGLFNPYGYFTKKSTAVEKEDLIKIGWTGARKISSLMYQDDFRKKIIAKTGGILKAYTLGYFPIIRNSVMDLGPGEGYSTKLDSKDNEESLFQLSPTLLREQQKYLAKSLEGKPTSEAFEAIRKFREYGPTEVLPSLKDKLEAKFAKKDEEIRAQELNKNKK